MVSPSSKPPVKSREAGVSSRRKGRPLLNDAVSREHILSVAARLFHERGYQATKVRDVASAVGISAGKQVRLPPSECP